MEPAKPVETKTPDNRHRTIGLCIYSAWWLPSLGLVCPHNAPILPVWNGNVYSVPLSVGGTQFAF